MQIQISWLLQKPTDLALHCLQKQGISGFSRTKVNCLPLIQQFLDTTWVINCTCSNFRTSMVRNWGVWILRVNTIPGIKLWCKPKTLSQIICSPVYSPNCSPIWGPTPIMAGSRPLYKPSIPSFWMIHVEAWSIDLYTYNIYIYIYLIEYVTQ